MIADQQAAAAERDEALRETLRPMVGLPSHTIAARLTETGVQSPRGGPWSHNTVQRVLARQAASSAARRRGSEPPSPPGGQVGITSTKYGYLMGRLSFSRWLVWPRNRHLPLAAVVAPAGSRLSRKANQQARRRSCDCAGTSKDRNS